MTKQHSLRGVVQNLKVRDELIGNIRDLLGPDYDVEKHFTPPYRPWRQRIAFVPDADLFKSIADGKASVVTSEIDKFISEGIQLESGEILKLMSLSLLLALI